MKDIAPCNISTVALHCQYCTAKYYIGSLLSILHRGISRPWHWQYFDNIARRILHREISRQLSTKNIASRNISTVASHEEYFLHDIPLMISHREISHPHHQYYTTECLFHSFANIATVTPHSRHCHLVYRYPKPSPKERIISIPHNS